MIANPDDRPISEVRIIRHPRADEWEALCKIKGYSPYHNLLSDHLLFFAWCETLDFDTSQKTELFWLWALGPDWMLIPIPLLYEEFRRNHSDIVTDLSINENIKPVDVLGEWKRLYDIYGDEICRTE